MYHLHKCPKKYFYFLSIQIIFYRRFFISTIFTQKKKKAQERQRIRLYFSYFIFLVATSKWTDQRRPHYTTHTTSAGGITCHKANLFPTRLGKPSHILGYKPGANKELYTEITLLTRPFPWHESLSFASDRQLQLRLFTGRVFMPRATSSRTSRTWRYSLQHSGINWSNVTFGYSIFSLFSRFRVGTVY